MTNKDFQVKTEIFEGPLDLLLNLIERRKLLINEISLAQVTDDFIEYIKSFDQKSIKMTSDFISTASILLLIKSKSLLPTLELSKEEESSVGDLERRLKIYDRLKKASRNIEEMFGKKILYTRNSSNNENVVFSPTKQLTTKTICASIDTLINLLPKKEKISKAVIKKVISLEDMIERLTKRVKQGLQMKFTDFANFDKEEKVNILVGFLAMLELVKQGLISVKQEDEYSDINIETTIVDTPKYN